MRYHSQVVTNHDEGQPAFAAQVFQQIKYFCLHRSVKRRCGLVQQQNLRLQNQRARNGNALALSARQLVRIPEPEPGSHAHFVQRALNAHFRVVYAVNGQWLGQNAVDGLARVQRSIRVLEHHLHQAPEWFAARKRQCIIGLA